MGVYALLVALLICVVLVCCYVCFVMVNKLSLSLSLSYYLLLACTLSLVLCGFAGGQLFPVVLPQACPVIMLLCVFLYTIVHRPDMTYIVLVGR